MTRCASTWQILLLAFVTSLSGCDERRNPGPQGDSHTNWLRTCEADRDCNGLQCLCGVCTASCTSDEACADAPGASCVASGDPGAIAVCGGQTPPVAGLCLPSCSEQSCPTGQACVAGACQPMGPPGAQVAIDTSTKLQSLTGFGANIGYAEDEIIAYSAPDKLNDAMFVGLGLDVLRFRNRYGDVSDATLAQATTIVSSAQQSLGRAPLVLLSSWSPPSKLKQNGSTFCSNPATCTLSTNASGAFDYAGLATYWRSSLDAYAKRGFVPDYIGIQNNADWTPTGSAAAEACKFLPSEGSQDVIVNDVTTSVKYPGYREALAAVLTALTDMPTRPRLLAPELNGMHGTDSYLSQLDATQVDAVAHHMYGSKPADLDLDSLRALSALGSDRGVPLFQTEMQADGFDTAVLIHHALVEGGASMYLQTALIGPLSGPNENPSALIGLEGDTLVLQDAYFAMSHFSRFTDPGWTRVAATTTTPGLLTTAWQSPKQDALTVVLVNDANATLTVALDLGAETVGSAELHRTVFDGSEHFADLGAWPIDSPISLPPRSVATVVLKK